MKYLYLGIFVDSTDLFSLFPPTLEKVIEYPHITLGFKMPYESEVLLEPLFNMPVNILIQGYGKNETNEGVRVSVLTDNIVLNQFLSEIVVPHITLSVSEDGKPVNTKNVQFMPIEPSVITGKVGAMSRGSLVFKPI